MNYVTTNIRLPEEDYLRLKQEAARKRQSLSAVIREKVSEKKVGRSKKEVEKFMQQMRQHAAKNAKKLQGINGVAVIREMRDNPKW